MRISKHLKSNFQLMSKYAKKTFYTFEKLKNNLSKPIYLNESCLLNDLTKYMPLPPPLQMFKKCCFHNHNDFVEN